MQKMDAGTLFRFSDSCKTFRKLTDEHPELFRRCIVKQYDKAVGFRVSDGDLRGTVHRLVNTDRNDPIVGKIMAEKEEKKRLQEAAAAAKLRIRKHKHPDRYKELPEASSSSSSSSSSTKYYYF